MFVFRKCRFSLLFVLMIGLIPGIADPPPPPNPKGECRWISGHKTVNGDVVGIRANKGEVVTIKCSFLNKDKPRKVFIVVGQDPRPDAYVLNGFEVVQAPCFAKDDFKVGEIQTCMLKVRINSDSEMSLVIYFVDESRSTLPNRCISWANIGINMPSEKQSKIVPWDESILRDFRIKP